MRAAQTLVVEHKGDSFSDRYDRLMIGHRCREQMPPSPACSSRVFRPAPHERWVGAQDCCAGSAQQRRW